MIILLTIKQSGNFNKTEKFFKGVVTSGYVQVLEKYANIGLRALIMATPMDSGKSAISWDYEIRQYAGGASITWTNSNMSDKVPIVVLLQYGHATKDGGYVQGRDFINPALKPVFDRLSDELWREVTSL